jgi:hypothetical protein
LAKQVPKTSPVAGKEAKSKPDQPLNLEKLNLDNPEHLKKLNLYCQDTLDGTICVDIDSGNIVVTPRIKDGANPAKVAACKVLFDRVSTSIMKGKPTEWKMGQVFKKDDEDEDEEK